MCHNEDTHASPPAPAPAQSRSKSPVCVEIHVHVYNACQHQDGSAGHDHANMRYSDLNRRPYAWDHLLPQGPPPAPVQEISPGAELEPKPDTAPAPGGTHAGPPIPPTAA
jgi:hypothetical protein